MEGMLLVINYHTLSKDFASIIRKNLYILHMNNEIFTPVPMMFGKLSCKN